MDLFLSLFSSVIGWVASLPLWISIPIGVWLYIFIGYKWGKKGKEVYCNWESSKTLSKFVCFPLAALRNYKPNANDLPYKVDKESYIPIMTFGWPIKLVMSLVVFLFVFIVGIIVFIVTNKTIKNILFLENINLSKRISRCLKGRADKRERKEAELKAKADKHPLQAKMDELNAQRSKLAQKTKEIMDIKITCTMLETEIERAGKTAYRG